MTSRETVSTLATTKTFVPPLLPQPSLPRTARSTPQPPPRAALLKELFGVTLDPVGRTYFSRSAATVQPTVRPFSARLSDWSDSRAGYHDVLVLLLVPTIEQYESHSALAMPWHWSPTTFGGTFDSPLTSHRHLSYAAGSGTCAVTSELLN